MRVRELGEASLQAIFDAGPERLRPILMMSAAMVLGMLPTALSHGDGSEFRAMAIAVIGGVVSWALLSLVVVPTCYLASENAKAKICALRGLPPHSRVGTAATPPPSAAE